VTCSKVLKRGICVIRGQRALRRRTWCHGGAREIRPCRVFKVPLRKRDFRTTTGRASGEEKSLVTAGGEKKEEDRS